MTETANLEAWGSADNDKSGRSVAVSGDGETVVAGAYWHAAGGTQRGAAYIYTRSPGGWTGTNMYDAKLTASDGRDQDVLGISVAVSGDGSTVVAGAPGNGSGGSERGAAYVYVRPPTGWTNLTQTAKLTADDGADSDELGFAVAVSEDGQTVVAGAPWNDAGGFNRGAAYVYARPPGGWVGTATFSAKLTASDGADGDRLGYAVAVSGNGETVAAGAVDNDVGGTSRGAVYVYERPPGGWATTTEIAKLTASDGADNDLLGLAVAVSLDGGTVVAGAPYNAGGGTQRGAAYVYTRPPGGWTNATQTAKLTASDGVDNDRLGSALAVSHDGEFVVAGAGRHAAGGTKRGATYVYVRPPGGWVSTAAYAARLTASDGADEDRLGCAVAVSGDGELVIAGAPYHGAGGTERGAVYVYVRPPAGWASTAAYAARLTASDGADGDYLGYAVAVSADGKLVAAGAPGYEGGGVDLGAVYVYARPPGDWATTGVYTAKLTSGDGVDGDEFGVAVALSGGGHTVVAGAPYSDAGGLDRGAAYVYAQPPKHFVFLPLVVRNYP
jgi:hypothetical protein